MCAVKLFSCWKAACRNTSTYKGRARWIETFKVLRLVARKVYKTHQTRCGKGWKLVGSWLLPEPRCNLCAPISLLWQPNVEIWIIANILQTNKTFLTSFLGVKHRKHAIIHVCCIVIIIQYTHMLQSNSLSLKQMPCFITELFFCQTNLHTHPCFLTCKKQHVHFYLFLNRCGKCFSCLQRLAPPKEF